MTVVAIRVDATKERGFGNLSRAMTIGEALRENGHRPVFVSRGSGFAAEYLESRGIADVGIIGEDTEEFDAILASGPGIVIFDVGNTTHAAVAGLKDNGVYVITFDDLGDGRYLADIVVDANLTPKTNPKPMETPTSYLLGPMYVVFNKETLAARRKRRHFRELRRIVVTCGGTDPSGVTPRIVAALGAVDTDIDVDVVLGPGFTPTRELNEVILAAPREFDISQNPADLAVKLRTADLGILSGGLTIFEAAYLGLPSIVISQSETQARNVIPLAERGAIADFGPATAKSAASLFAKLPAEIQRLTDASLRRTMGEAGQSFVDGKGVKRLMQEIKRLIGT